MHSILSNFRLNRTKHSAAQWKNGFLPPKLNKVLFFYVIFFFTKKNIFIVSYFSAYMYVVDTRWNSHSEYLHHAFMEKHHENVPI